MNRIANPRTSVFPAVSNRFVPGAFIAFITFDAAERAGQNR
ncbi:hypothetical protein [Burkholderia sp. 22313]|nr:hypothetical protein [Burkholderia sp.]